MISQELAMQWAKSPRPTTYVSIQITITEPVMECEAETSHAARAIIQPAMTPDQKTVNAGCAIAFAPSSDMVLTNVGSIADVCVASLAKANAPRTLVGRTMAQRRIVFQNWRFSLRTRATG